MRASTGPEGIAYDSDRDALYVGNESDGKSVLIYCLDHTFWAWRLGQLGVAPPKIKRHRLTAAAMSDAIRQAIENPSFRTRAAEVAPAISAENGLERAVRLLEDHFSRHT